MGMQVMRPRAKGVLIAPTLPPQGMARVLLNKVGKADIRRIKVGGTKVHILNKVVRLDQLLLRRRGVAFLAVDWVGGSLPLQLRRGPVAVTVVRLRPLRLRFGNSPRAPIACLRQVMAQGKKPA